MIDKRVESLADAVAGIGEDGQQRYRRAILPAAVKRDKKKTRTSDPHSPFAELDKHALFGAAGQAANKNRAVKGGA
ncbi:MAG: hypothetical protein QF767_14370 [Alphaproteobacteria bacterium]|nr:hypothetical protein [Alphaproteobacteria bacterium]